jgi:hypothetical protein
MIDSVRYDEHDHVDQPMPRSTTSDQESGTPARMTRVSHFGL